MALGENLPSPPNKNLSVKGTMFPKPDFLPVSRAFLFDPTGHLLGITGFLPAAEEDQVPVDLAELEEVD